MKINGFGKRFLSLLLAMVALVGLLSVGAMAEGTAPSVTLKVQNVQRDGNTVTADVVVAETVSAEYGIAAGEFTVVVPDGLTLTSIQSNVYRSSNPDGIEGLNAASNVATCYFGFFINILEYDAWLGGGKLATLTFTVKDGAYGDQVIGIKNPALGTSGSSGSSGVEVDENSRLPMNTPTSGTLSLPSVTLTFDANGHGTAPEAKEMAVNTVPEEPSPAPTATGYTFGGWYTDEGCTDGAKFDFTEPLKEDATVYAKWTAKTTKITLGVDGGTLPEESAANQTFTYDSEYTLPRPTKTGFRFNGWKTSDGTTIDQAGTWNREDAELTLKAEWIPKGDVPVKLDEQTYTYDGEQKSFMLESTDGSALPAGISVQYSEKGKNSFSTSAPSAVGEYDVKLSREDDDEYKALEETSTLVIEKATVELPTLKTNSFEYNGTSYTVELSESSTVYSLNASSATDKGEYWAKVTINESVRDNYKWASLEGRDDVRAVVDDPYSIELKYTITPKKITAPTADTTSFTYDGNPKTYDLALGDGMGFATDSADRTQTDAGTYTIKVELTDKVNTTWSDGSTADKEYTFTIKKAELELPELTSNSFEWTGTAPSVTLKPVTDSDKYALEASSVTATDKGSYYAKVTINESARANYKWAGMAEDVVTVELPYTITAMKITPPTAADKSYTFNETELTFEFSGFDDEHCQVVNKSNKQTNAGNYTVTVALKDKDNTTWSDGTTVDKTYSFVIEKADQAAPTGLTTVDETIYKKGDGKLMGLDKALMEYRLKDSTAEFVQPARDEITLPAGTYEVRYAEDQNHNASPVTEVTVAEGRRLSVTFDTGAGSDVDSQNDLGYKDPVAKPDPAPTYPGFTLVGWYKDEEYKVDWDFATDRVEADTDLYAKWELSIGIEGDARFTEGKAPAEGVKIIVGKGLDQTDTQTLELKKVTVAGKKLDDENYTVAYGEDGLTITLKQDYLNTLGVDEYEIGVVVDSEHLGEGRNLAVTLTVDPEPTEAGKPAGKPGKAVKTGDSSDLLLWSILSLGAGAGLVCIGKKRREN